MCLSQFFSSIVHIYKFPSDLSVLFSSGSSDSIRGIVAQSRIRNHSHYSSPLRLHHWRIACDWCGADHSRIRSISRPSKCSRWALLRFVFGCIVILHFKDRDCFDIEEILRCNPSCQCLFCRERSLSQYPVVCPTDQHCPMHHWVRLRSITSCVSFACTRW